eukprot:CAMPEP_0181053880 /NCGR_PEP_ID=MMETSP1070-20121207/18371_1 /TAXON_ID=265543 /ORGANISM="Minutocellus polymorphus, Strain NH13" /LENGTH=245 /DNA_ID=CAMNT_0023133093 /DNA_START=18 /DNA_END=755 /DNA_ORIENTATION=+
MVTKTAVVNNKLNDNAYIVTQIRSSEANRITAGADGKSVGSGKSRTSKTSASSKKSKKSLRNIPSSVSVPSTKSMYTIHEEESLAGISTASSVTTTWGNPKRDESSWQKKYKAEKKINDELRKQVGQRDGEIDHIGQQAYKKVEKLRSQREMRDLRIAELEKKLALREEELARERNKHDNTKVALRGQMEDTTMAREEAAGLKKQVIQLQSRLGLVAQAFGGKNVDMDVGPSISYARRSSSARAA